MGMGGSILKRSLIQSQSQELQYPIMLKVMTDDETRAYHRKKLFELSIKSLGQIPQLDDLNEEQQQWIERKMKGRFV
jgi:hypothetical protein